MLGTVAALGYSAPTGASAGGHVLKSPAGQAGTAGDLREVMHRNPPLTKTRMAVAPYILLATVNQCLPPLSRRLPAPADYTSRPAVPTPHPLAASLGFLAALIHKAISLRLSIHILSD